MEIFLGSYRVNLSYNNNVLVVKIFQFFQIYLKKKSLENVERYNI